MAVLAGTPADADPVDLTLGLLRSPTERVDGGPPGTGAATAEPLS